MKKLYCKPEAENVRPDFTSEFLQATQSPDETIPVINEPADPGTALSGDSPIWDDTQK